LKLRGAIIGFGAVAAEGHIPGWATRPEIQIVAVCDPISERRHHALRILKGVRVYDDPGLMLDGERPDFVDVASPPAFHMAAVRAALEAGAHVIVEKPLCLELEEFDALVELARIRGRVLMCVHNWKHAPAYRRAFDLIASGRIGEVREITLERLRTGPAGGEGPGARWRRDPKLGGGILIDHGWHTLYLAQWLMGGTPPQLAAAALGGNREGGAEEEADLHLTFAGERRAAIHLSWHAAARVTSASIKGDHATLELQDNAVCLTDVQGRHDLSVVDAADDSYHATWFGALADEFERAVNSGGGSIVETNLAESRAALAIILQAREAARGNRG
jgi:predicted dehydrogenase